MDRRLLETYKESLAAEGSSPKRHTCPGTQHMWKQKWPSWHAKPPYSYQAMMALEIQTSPPRGSSSLRSPRRTAPFPLFQKGSQGWEDSEVVLSPLKSKGNFWVVHRDCISPKALQLQGAPVSRRDEASSVQDLSPDMLRSWSSSASCRIAPQAQPHPSAPAVLQSVPSPNWAAPLP